VGIRKRHVADRAFVLEIDGRRTLAFFATDLARARSFCSEPWFLDELGTLKSCGSPIWDGKANLRIRCADQREATELDIAMHSEKARGEYEGYVFSFFVPVDATLQ
jgi:hypothetical protein